MPNVAINNLSETWNNAGTTFTGIKLNVTDTASASGSLLLDVQKGGTSQVVIDKNGRLGIGPSAPAQKLDVYGAGAVFADIASSDANAVGIRLGISAVANRANVIYTSSGLQLATVTATPLLFQTNGTEKMRLDSSGNLGLGVTPSAWTISAFQSSLGVFAGNTEFNTSANAYYDGAWKYIGTGVASRYSHAGASHSWYTAISGTAGNTVTWIERFSASPTSFIINDPGADYDFRVEGDTDANLFFVDASTDRVGIGTNAPGYKLDVRSNAPSVKSWVSSVNTSATAGGAGFISLLSGVSGTPYSTFNTLSEGSLEIENIGISGAGAILFRNTGTERMRIDASGNVVINTAAIATNATNGFLYVPSCAGTPTGTPTAYTGRVPIVVDSTNNKLYFYSGGAWRDAGP